MRSVVFLILIFLSLLFPLKVTAKSLPQFITIVNPVRISSYTNDPITGLNAQYEEISKRNLAASWLLTYQVISHKEMVELIKKMDKDQELGIFIEVTPQFAKDSKIIYRKEDSWHRSNSLFLSGYTQEDRKKLIDTVFNKFKETFGYYPASVGSWWTDSFSLAYMKEKYGISANLTCADQFETDGYHIWGQYWGTPFYPSKYHAGIPAKEINSKLDLVTIQWAPRDPLNGYKSSLYSSQDYLSIGLQNDYYEKIINLYARKNHNDFGQITLGLEGDFSAETYKNNFAQQMQLLANLKETGNFQITTMKQFSNWYRSRFKNQTPPSFMESDDLLGKPLKVLWYQSPNYRIGMVYNQEEEKITVVDLRTYFDNFYEPFYQTPNFQIDLFINIPSVIDSISNPKDGWEITGLKLKSIENRKSEYSLNFEDGKRIILTENSIIFKNFENNLKKPSFISNSPKVNYKETGDTLIVYPKNHFSYGNEGLIISDLSINATYFFLRPKIRLFIMSIAGIITITSVAIVFFTRNRVALRVKLLAVIYLPFLMLYLIIFLINSQKYSVNQSEIDALEHLSVLPFGKVIVFDGGCLICKWKSKYPPPAFAYKKEYISWLSKKPIVYNKSVFQSETREEGRLQLRKLKAKYFYLIKYEGLVEKMPFSPGDLNVEKIYENAHTQIWQVKDS